MQRGCAGIGTASFFDSCELPHKTRRAGRKIHSDRAAAGLLPKVMICKSMASVTRPAERVAIILATTLRGSWV